MLKLDVLVCYKEAEEPEEFTNMVEFEIVKDGKFLYLTTNIEMEYYIPLINVMWFQINYKGGKQCLT